MMIDRGGEGACAGDVFACAGIRDRSPRMGREGGYKSQNGSGGGGGQ